MHLKKAPCHIEKLKVNKVANQTQFFISHFKTVKDQKTINSKEAAVIRSDAPCLDSHDREENNGEGKK